MNNSKQEKYRVLSTFARTKQQKLWYFSCNTMQFTFLYFISIEAYRIECIIKTNAFQMDFDSLLFLLFEREDTLTFTIFLFMHSEYRWMCATMRINSSWYTIAIIQWGLLQKVGQFFLSLRYGCCIDRFTHSIDY